MRAVVQRVTSARVTVDNRVTGEIAAGLLILLGVQDGDGPADVQYVASKIRDLQAKFRETDVRCEEFARKVKELELANERLQGSYRVGVGFGVRYSSVCENIDQHCE